VISSQGEDQLALLCELVNLIADLPCNSAAEFGPLHVTIGRVVGGRDLGKVMNLAIKGHIELEVFFQLLNQAGFNEGDGRRIDTGLWLLRCQRNDV
jgi:hypothetical protein